MTNPKHTEEAKGRVDIEHLTVWITAYVMTQGIIKVDATINHAISSTMVKFKLKGLTYTYAHGLNWHRTEQEAIAEANRVLSRKLSAARVQVALWSKFSFDTDNLKIKEV